MDNLVQVRNAGPRHAEIATDPYAAPGFCGRGLSEVEAAALRSEHGLVLLTHDSRLRRALLDDPIAGDEPGRQRRTGEARGTAGLRSCTCRGMS